MEFPLGKLVRCSITGFTGIAISETRFLTGCNRVVVQPQAGADGKLPDSHYIDSTVLQVIGEGVTLPTQPHAIQSGGPHRMPAERRDPPAR